MNKEFAAKKAELTKRGLAVISVLALAVLACVGGGGDSDAVKTQNAYDATATYGSEQFGKQRTAIYETQQAETTPKVEITPTPFQPIPPTAVK